jgi:hypothetical protein
MKDFDGPREQRLREREARFAEEDKDRSFKLGGEIFEYRLMFPYAAADAIFSVTADSGVDFLTDRINTATKLIIEPGEKDEALKRLERVKHLIEVQDLQAVVFWIMGEIAERPTQAPSPSGDGRETTVANSTEPSSSDPEAVAVSGV